MPNPSKQINCQTIGPAWVDDDGCIATGSGDDYQTIAEVYGPNAIARKSEKHANKHLIAASYTAFDKAGRELGIDAAALAQTLDIEALIVCLRATVLKYDIARDIYWRRMNLPRPQDDDPKHIAFMRAELAKISAIGRGKRAERG